MAPKIRVIIPAYNEQESIGKVIAEIPEIVSEIIVVSNNSSDDTELVAKSAGATVLRENQKGLTHIPSFFLRPSNEDDITLIK